MNEKKHFVHVGDTGRCLQSLGSGQSVFPVDLNCSFKLSKLVEGGTVLKIGEKQLFYFFTDERAQDRTDCWEVAQGMNSSRLPKLL